MALIEIRDLAKSFGNVKAVDVISLDIESGEFITLLGPSGSGKTTVLRMIAGFEDPDAGSIKLNGGDITHLPPFDRDVVATVVILLSLIPVYISQRLARAQEEER